MREEIIYFWGKINCSQIRPSIEVDYFQEQEKYNTITGNIPVINRLFLILTYYCYPYSYGVCNHNLNLIRDIE